MFPWLDPAVAIDSEERLELSVGIRGNLKASRLNMRQSRVAKGTIFHSGSNKLVNNYCYIF